MDFHSFVDRLEEVSGSVKGNEWTVKACCPAHDDRVASLSVRDAGDKVLVYCHAGCSAEAITKALGLSLKDLYSDSEMESYDVSEEQYPYEDEGGELLYTKIRFPEKRFAYQRPNGEWGRGDTRKVLYKLPQLIDAIALGHEVWIVEGEKDVETLNARGISATTAGGVSDWQTDYPRYFSGARVVIVADKDERGRESARRIGDSLWGIAERIRIIESRVGKDITDHIEAGRELGEVKECQILTKKDFLRFLRSKRGLSVYS